MSSPDGPLAASTRVPQWIVDAELVKRGDVRIDRGRRQDRAVIAKQPLKRTRVGFEDGDGVAFHGEVERGGQTGEPGADDGDALRLAVGSAARGECVA